MDWSTFLTYVAQGIIGAVLAVFVFAFIAGVHRWFRSQPPLPPKPPERSWDGYYDESGGPR